MMSPQSLCYGSAASGTPQEPSTGERDHSVAQRKFMGVVTFVVVAARSTRFPCPGRIADTRYVVSLSTGRFRRAWATDET